MQISSFVMNINHILEKTSNQPPNKFDNQLQILSNQFDSFSYDVGSFSGVGVIGIISSSGISEESLLR